MKCAPRLPYISLLLLLVCKKLVLPLILTGLPADDIQPTIFLSIDFAEKDIAMPIEYVHELQQAMRIMGCDKTIEL